MNTWIDVHRLAETISFLSLFLTYLDVIIRWGKYTCDDRENNV